MGGRETGVGHATAHQPVAGGWQSLPPLPPFPWLEPSAWMRTCVEEANEGEGNGQ